METFGHLLNEYIQRSGISDAELARAIGVSRQTIFRWREGLTARPRVRDDVLVIVRKLRLTPEERDRLLLAAGFRPEENLAQAPQSSDEEDAVSEMTSPVEAAAGAKAGETAREAALRRQAERSENGRMGWQQLAGTPGRLFALGGIIALVLVALVWFSAWPGSGKEVDPLDPQPAGLAGNLSAATTPPASEPTIILIAHFANYASSQVGYNVAGRLAEALQREIDNLRLENTRLDLWPEEVAERAEAVRVGREAKATLVIYGEYDVGRIVVKFAHPADETIFDNPALSQHTLTLEDLSTAVNSDLPRQVRSLALIALGQIYLNQEQAALALPLLSQARNNLRGDPDIEPETWAVANFFLGIAYQHSRPAQLDEAIAAYGEASDSWPEMIASRLNRIAAYETRNRPGDLELALAEADALVERAPKWALAYNNRASIRLAMGGAENLSLALADLEQTLALEPDLAEAYLNRAIAHFGQGQTVAAILPDVEKALELRSGYGNALNLLCWGYGLEGQPEQAMPYCQQAVEAKPDEPLFLDSRGLAYALSGDDEAAMADFEVYAAWLEAEQPGQEWERDAMRRRAWIAALAEGENPFTPQLLAMLRAEMRN